MPRKSQKAPVGEGIYESSRSKSADDVAKIRIYITAHNESDGKPIKNNISKTFYLSGRKVSDVGAMIVRVFQK